MLMENWIRKDELVCFGYREMLSKMKGEIGEKVRLCDLHSFPSKMLKLANDLEGGIQFVEVKRRKREGEEEENEWELLLIP